MSDWKRTTKEVSPENLPPEMIAAINKHIEQHNLGPILTDALMCIQTDSEKTKKGLFGGAETVRMGVVFTPRWLVWAVSGTKTTGTWTNIGCAGTSKTLSISMGHRLSGDVRRRAAGPEVLDDPRES